MKEIKDCLRSYTGLAAPSPLSQKRILARDKQGSKNRFYLEILKEKENERSRDGFFKGRESSIQYMSHI